MGLAVLYTDQRASQSTGEAPCNAIPEMETTLYQHLGVARPKEFLTPQDFLVEAVRYFRWCDDHPLKEEQVFNYKGCVVRADKNKVRPYTKQGFATYCAIPVSRLNSYKNRSDPEWQDAIEIVEQAMHDQKFTGAVTGLMNAMMIKSDLGMVDRSELTGKDGGAIVTKDLNAQEELLDEARRLGIDVAALGFGSSTAQATGTGT